MRQTMRLLKKIPISLVAIILLVLLACVVMYFVLFKPRGGGKMHQKCKQESFTSSKEEVNVKMFYVDWCGHCKSTKPGFKEFMDKYNGTQVNKKQVKIEMINCEENEKLASEYEVKGYPTIIAEVNGKKKIYDSSDRTAGGFSNWLENLV